MVSRNSPVLTSHLNFSICSGKPEAEAKVHLLWGTLAVGQVIWEALPCKMPAMFRVCLTPSTPVHVQQLQTCYYFAQAVPPGWPKFAFFLMNNVTSEKQKKMHPKKLKPVVTLNL